MTQPLPLKSRLNKTLPAVALTIFFIANPVSAKEELNLKQSKTIKSIKFSKDMKVRGIKLGDGVYMGQAKVAGKYGIGVVVDKKSYFWGINHRGVSISKRF